MRPWRHGHGHGTAFGTSAGLVVGLSIACLGCAGPGQSREKQPPSADAVAGASSHDGTRDGPGRDPERELGPEADQATDVERADQAALLGPAKPGPLAVLRLALTPEQTPRTHGPGERRRPQRAPKELWRTRIGITTYRSTIHVDDGQVIVNSNGASLKSTNDRDDVVWILSSASGEAERRLTPRPGGERDCNGVALDGEVVAFGTDQGELYAFEKQGTALWRSKLDGDVESAPAFAELDGHPGLDLVVATEGGTVYGIEGKRGRILWQHSSGKGAYGQRGFLASPAVVDVTGDGRAEVFIGGRDGSMRCLDGRNGQLRWELSGRTGMHTSPVLLDLEGDGRMEVAFSESYGHVYLADALSGRLRWSTKLPIGLMGSMGWYPDARCLMAGTAWFGKDERVYCIAVESGEVRWHWQAPSDKISSGFVVGDLDGTPGAEVVFGTEGGLLVALGSDGKERWVVDIDAPVECSPTIADLDGDDRVDVLVSSTDGYLRALETSGFPPATVGYFRGDAHNSGVF